MASHGLQTGIDTPQIYRPPNFSSFQIAAMIHGGEQVFCPNFDLTIQEHYECLHIRIKTENGCTKLRQNVNVDMEVIVFSDNISMDSEGNFLVMSFFYAEDGESRLIEYAIVFILKGKNVISNPMIIDYFESMYEKFERRAVAKERTNLSVELMTTMEVGLNWKDSWHILGGLERMERNERGGVEGKETEDDDLMNAMVSMVMRVGTGDATLRTVVIL